MAGDRTDHLSIIAYHGLTISKITVEEQYHQQCQLINQAAPKVSQENSRTAFCIRKRICHSRENRPIMPPTLKKMLLKIGSSIPTSTRECHRFIFRDLFCFARICGKFFSFFSSSCRLSTFLRRLLSIKRLNESL